MVGTDPESDGLEAMPTMGGLPSIYWPFIAIGIWHFVTAAGRSATQHSATSFTGFMALSGTCPSSGTTPITIENRPKPPVLFISLTIFTSLTIVYFH